MTAMAVENVPRPTTGHQDTRRRMIDSAVALLRERSATGVTIDAVLARSGAPRGSVYHHFPGGRDQIVLEAVAVAGRYVAELIARSEEGGDPSAVVRRFLDFWERMLLDSDYLAGCPVVSLTVDSRADQPDAIKLVEEIFLLWQSRLRSVLVSSGIEVSRAGRLATMIVAAAEGAVLLSRAQRSLEPLHDVCDELGALIEATKPTDIHPTGPTIPTTSRSGHS